jgi:hypothetical protein
MAITTITRPELANIRGRLQDIAAELARATGLAVKVGNCRFNESNAKFELEFAVVAETGIAMTKEARSFILNAALLGMSPDDLGKKFTTSQGNRYEFVGFNSKARTMPMIAREISTGKSFKFTTNTMKIYLTQEVK